LSKNRKETYSIDFGAKKKAKPKKGANKTEWPRQLAWRKVGKAMP